VHGYNPSAVLPPRKWRRYLFALGVVCVVPSLSGIVVESRQWHGRQIRCIHGGAWVTRPKACGTLDYEYQRVFTGTVQSVTEISDTDRRLEIKPKEVFLGESKDNVTAILNQACLTPNDPEIKVGDKWLFYLRTNRSFTADGKPTARTGQLEIPFDGPSKPLRQARKEVAELRRLARMTDSGIVSGNLLSFVIGNGGVIQNHKVTATRQPDGAQYAAQTDSDGNFKFDPLPAGTYELSANTADGLWAGKTRNVEVHSGKCSTTQFWLQTDGIISGHVGNPENKPFLIHPWVQIVSLDDQRFDSAYVDAEGNFEARGVEPGRYVVGLGIQAGTGYFNDLPIPVYYPGVRTKEEATIIQLGRAEKRTNVNFDLPAEDVAKFMKHPPIPPKDVLQINVGLPVNH
jgi:hypothetical protein